MVGSLRHWRTRVGFLVAVALAASLFAGMTSASPARLSVEIIPAGGTLHGATYDEWFGRWLSWVVRTPTPMNPLANPKNCAIAPQPGKRVRLLSASSGGRLTVSCTIQKGRSLFVPVAGTLGYGEKPADTFAALRKGLRSFFAETTLLRVSVDGVPVPGLRALRATTRNLVLDLPQANILGVPAGKTRVVAAGYNVLFKELAPGRHTIVTYAEQKSPGQPVFKAGMTYRLTVE